MPPYTCTVMHIVDSSSNLVLNNLQSCYWTVHLFKCAPAYKRTSLDVPLLICHDVCKMFTLTQRKMFAQYLKSLATLLCVTRNSTAERRRKLAQRSCTLARKGSHAKDQGSWYAWRRENGQTSSLFAEVNGANLPSFSFATILHFVVWSQFRDFRRENQGS